MNEHKSTRIEQRIAQIVGIIKSQGSITRADLALEIGLSPSSLEKYLRLIFPKYPEITEFEDKIKAKDKR